MKTGAIEYISKPVDKKDYTNTIYRAVERRTMFNGAMGMAVAKQGPSR